MLFRKKITRACVYCTYGTCLDDGKILCCRKGVKESQDKCLRFKYDPCKRIPVKAKPLDFSRYEQNDFSL